jgi:deoxyribonuclease I
MGGSDLGRDLLSGVASRAIAPSPSPAVIIGNKQSKVYHRQGCPGFTMVKPRNRVPFASAAEAEAAGYTKAGNCP